MNEIVSLQHVLSDDCLFEAWSKVRENQAAVGVDGVSLEDFAQRLFIHLDDLRHEVTHQQYQPQALLRMFMDKDDQKSRLLSIPTVRDRVLQTAVALTLTPLFEAEFEDCSFAYRKGRSVDMAVRAVMRYREQGYHWVVDADIFSFFDEIDHELMLEKVSSLVKDESLLSLIKLWLKNTVTDGERTWTLQKGVPQGSPLSPLLSNLYLDDLDEALLENNLCLVRFADDFLVLCKDEPRAEKALAITEQVLSSLKLRVNQDKTRLVNFDRGFQFLGVEFVSSLVSTVEPEISSIPHAPEVRVNADHRSTTYGEASRSVSNDSNQHDSLETFRDDLPDFALDQAEEIVTSQREPLLRTLYIVEHGCALAKESERLLVKKKGQIIREIPIIKLDQVLIFGGAQITTPAMKLCLAEKIPIVLLSSTGRYHGVIDSFDTDPVLLHRDQFRRAEDPHFCLSAAKSIITGKLANSRVVLTRYARRHDNKELTSAIDALKHLKYKVSTALSLDQLRGFEGAGAKAYFGAISGLLGAPWKFQGRKRQPPPDPVNALLSYGYTLLFYNVFALLRARGLNPHVGYLHPVRSGHPALVSDLMEEFRSIIVDTTILSLLLNQRIQVSEFEFDADQQLPCRLGASARKVFIRAFEKKMNDTLRHPVTGVAMDYRRCIEAQVNEFAAVLRGKKDQYTPMVLR